MKSILDFRFWIFDFEMGIAKLRRNRKSKIKNQKVSTRGVTILEVLFSIMLTTVGLLGAIALFPVASARARKARLNDAVAVSASSAVHMFDTMGMRRPYD